MDLPPGVQRLWRLSRGDGGGGAECIGAIVEGYVPGLTPSGSTGFVAYFSVVRSGPQRPHVEPDGRRFVDASWIGDSRQYCLPPCESLEEALAGAETHKQELLAAGWREIPLDPVNDPD